MSCCDSLNNGKVKYDEYASDIQPTWCSGCGNFGIWTALKRALVELEIAPKDVLLCFDIGCNGNMSDKIRGYRVHSLHGRVLPLAAGAKIANPRLRVIAMAGDGATYSEGINHFINSIRSNYPITFLVHNNGTYGLTTGQASATSPSGAERTANPYGATAEVLNPLSLALSLNPSYVARGFSGEIRNLTKIIKDAIAYQDNGFAYVDILQACPTYNKEVTHNTLMSSVQAIENLNHDNTNMQAAYDLVGKYPEVNPMGVIYKNPKLLNFLEKHNHLNISRGGNQNSYSPTNESFRNFDTSNLLRKFI